MINHLWQSTWFAAAAALLALAMRSHRADVRYWVWFAASLKFLVPFSVLMAIGSRLQWIPAAHRLAPAAVSIVAIQIVEPFRDAVISAPSPQHTAEWRPIALGVVWAVGFTTLLLVRFRNWRRVRAAIRAGTRLDLASPVEVRSSPGLLEPGVVGLFRPILLLPEGVEERLTPAQLASVLAHEFAHVRRRDNCTAALHMAVETIFWFHPLVWWIGARLVEERERACDEGVLSQGSQPRDYAEAILAVCKLYAESPLACISGVTGADLKKRIHAILDARVARNLTMGRKLTLSGAALSALLAPIAIGALHAPPAHGQSAASTPKFEVVSVKRCTGEGRPNSSPGRLSTGCTTIAYLIRAAYNLFGSGHLARDPSAPRIEGGPTWIQSDRYEVDARADGTPSEGMMMGPMMQNLLADRFQLQIRRETREVPVYALTVAKGGAKLTPFEEGSCTPVDFERRVPAIRPPNGCRVVVSTPRKGRSTMDLTAQGSTLAGLSKLLFLVMDRPVIDRTGISGRYNFQLAFAISENTVFTGPDGNPAFPSVQPPDEPEGASIFAVLPKQLGLKLEPTTGPRDFLVIDRVARPPEN